MIHFTKQDSFTEDMMRLKKQYQNLTNNIQHKVIVYFEEESLESAAKAVLSIFQS